jgi:hypothetical protein
MAAKEAAAKGKHAHPGRHRRRSRRCSAAGASSSCSQPRSTARLPSRTVAKASHRSSPCQRPTRQG